MTAEIKQYNNYLGRITTLVDVTRGKSHFYEVGIDVYYKKDDVETKRRTVVKIQPAFFVKRPLNKGEYVVFSTEKKGNQSKYIYEIKSVVGATDNNLFQCSVENTNKIVREYCTFNQDMWDVKR